jgi:hypothetical protein
MPSSDQGAYVVELPWLLAQRATAAAQPTAPTILFRSYFWNDWLPA